jgi:hypothetical protein
MYHNKAMPVNAVIQTTVKSSLESRLVVKLPEVDVRCFLSRLDDVSASSEQSRICEMSVRVRCTVGYNSGAR